MLTFGYPIYAYVHRPTEIIMHIYQTDKKFSWQIELWVTWYNVAHKYFHGFVMFPESKVLVAYVGPTWVMSAPGGPHVDPINLAISEFPIWWWHGMGVLTSHWPFVRWVSTKRVGIEDHWCFLVFSLNKFFNKQSGCRWFETLPCDTTAMYINLRWIHMKC